MLTYAMTDGLTISKVFDPVGICIDTVFRWCHQAKPVTSTLEVDEVCFRGPQKGTGSRASPAPAVGGRGGQSPADVLRSQNRQGVLGAQEDEDGGPGRQPRHILDFSAILMLLPYMETIICHPRLR